MDPQPIHDYYVPTINFDTLSYVAGLGTAGKGRYDPQKFTYEGPSQALKRMAVAVGALGTVLPIDPPSSNSSWTTEFHGPAVRCEPLPASESNAVEQNIREYIEYGSICWNAPGYITWIGDLPYISSLPKDENGSDIADAEPVVQPNDQPLSYANGSFRLAVLPQLLTVYQMSDGQVHSACSPGYDFLESYGNDTSLMLQCQLVNSTYDVAFDYVNGNQTVTIEVPQTVPEDTVAAISTITGPTNDTCVGFHAGYLLKQPDIPIENPDWPERCDFDQGLARQLAYRSILDAFFQRHQRPRCSGPKLRRQHPCDYAAAHTRNELFDQLRACHERSTSDVEECSSRFVRGGSSGPCWTHRARTRKRTAGARQRVGGHVPKPHRQPHEFDGFPVSFPIHMTVENNDFAVD